jgi:hypothetical protein
MALAMSDELNIEGLKQLYRSNKSARAFLDHCAKRNRNQAETKVDRILGLLQGEGHDLSRGDIIEVFRKLEELKCGTFVTGRKGWPSRFVWSVGMINVGRVAAGEPPQVEEVETEEGSEAMLVHSFHLRPETKVEFNLPADLTENEAERLAGFIKTLPIESD